MVAARGVGGGSGGGGKGWWALIAFTPPPPPGNLAVEQQVHSKIQIFSKEFILTLQTSQSAALLHHHYKSISLSSSAPHISSSTFSPL